MAKHLKPEWGSDQPEPGYRQDDPKHRKPQVGEVGLVKTQYSEVPVLVQITEVYASGFMASRVGDGKPVMGPWSAFTPEGVAS